MFHSGSYRSYKCFCLHSCLQASTLSCSFFVFLLKVKSAILLSGERLPCRNKQHNVYGLYQLLLLFPVEKSADYLSVTKRVKLVRFLSLNLLQTLCSFLNKKFSLENFGGRDFFFNQETSRSRQLLIRQFTGQLKATARSCFSFFVYFVGTCDRQLTLSNLFQKYDIFPTSCLAVYQSRHFFFLILSHKLFSFILHIQCYNSINNQIYKIIL